MRRSAFTLIELLISSAIFAIIAVIVVGTIASTVTVQETGKQSQVVSSELQQVMSVVQNAVSRAISSSVYIYPNNQQQPNSFLLLQTTATLADGTAGSSQYEVFCIDPTQAGHGIFTQYIMPTSAPAPTGFNGVSASTACGNSSIIAGWFGYASSSSIAATQLTDANSQISVSMTGFTVQPVSFSGGASPQAYDLEFAGTAQTTLEARAGTITPSPIIVHGTAVLANTPQVVNLSQ